MLSLLFSSVFEVAQQFEWPEHVFEAAGQPTQKHDVDSNSELCPNTNMWFVPDENGTCHCGDDIGGLVLCDPDTKVLGVMDSHCITNHYMSDHRMVPVVGNCIFNCINVSLSSSVGIYRAAPSNCQYMNRQGTLCGQCLDGYALPAYSYDMKCIPCDDKLQNWWLYITYAFLPLTVFIVIILLLRVNVVAPKLYVFVLAAQILASPLILRLILTAVSLHKRYRRTKILSVLATVYGIWNLDFLRIDVLPQICINVIPLHTLALDYLVAIYPMLLIGIVYIIVELHGSGFRPVLYMWRPFHRFFARFRRKWGIQTTIMDAFVTFFILSTTKLFDVSFTLLVGIRVFTPDGKYSWYLYYDPSVRYFGSDHLPYALGAIAMLIVFIFFPLSLLSCYHCKQCRKCIQRCHLQGLAVDQYVNTFQQYYKDGSNGTWDCRWFAGFLFLIRSTLFVIYSYSLSEISDIQLSVVSVIGAIITLIVQPYKEEYDVFNIINVNFLLWLGLLFASAAKDRVHLIL